MAIRLVHEFTHAYTLERGYNGKVGNSIQYIGENTANVDFLKGYAEATALKVEEQVRKDLGLPPRDQDPSIKPKAKYTFDFWPWEPFRDPDEKYHCYKINEEGVSLRESVWIIFDIWMNDPKRQ